MRTNNIGVKITIPIPYDKPDNNGVVCSEEVVAKATNMLRKNIPIIYKDNEKVPNGIAIGVTTGENHIVRWDFENQVCNVTVDGIVFYGGLEEIIKKNGDGKIDNFSIVAIGISK